MAGGAGVSGNGVGGISVAFATSSVGTGAVESGKEVTDMLQSETTRPNAQRIKLHLKFTQKVSFSSIQTIQRHRTFQKIMAMADWQIRRNTLELPIQHSKVFTQHIPQSSLRPG